MLEMPLCIKLVHGTRHVRGSKDAKLDSLQPFLWQRLSDAANYE
jgi:hypothetical protein